MQYAENPELTSMAEIPEFWFTGRYQSILTSGMCGLVCVSVSMSYSVCTPCCLEEYSVNNTALVPHCVCQALLSFSIEGELFKCNLCGGSVDGEEVGQRSSDLSAAAPL